MLFGFEFNFVGKWAYKNIGKIEKKRLFLSYLNAFTILFLDELIEE
jgi:hypothetical protein